MSTDSQLSTEDELELVRKWYVSDCQWRDALSTAVASLSAASLADEDIRESLNRRLRNLETSQQQWHALAVAGWCRRYWGYVEKEPRKWL